MATKKSITQKRPEYKSRISVSTKNPSCENFSAKSTKKISSTDNNLLEVKKHKEQFSSTLSEHFDSVLYAGAVLTTHELKKCVAALNENSQQELLDFILLQKMNRKQTSDQERKLEMLKDSLVVELGKHLKNSNMVFPLPQLPDVKKMFKRVEALMIDLKMSDLDSRDTKAMYNVIARFLVLHAGNVSITAKIPVTMKLVLQTNTTLHALLDNYFPGYMSAGLMFAVLKASRNGIVEDEGEDDE